jgi:hypothetical protein
MRRLLLICLGCAISSLAPGQGDTPADPGKNGRDELIRSALAKEKGEITVMEAAPGTGAVIIGYSSGALVSCSGDGDCRKLGGTPSGAVIGAVTDIAVSVRDGQEIIWAAYPHGVVYRCVNYACREALP